MWWLYIKVEETGDRFVYSEEEQRQLVGIIAQWLDMMEKNKAS